MMPWLSNLNLFIVVVQSNRVMACDKLELMWHFPIGRGWQDATIHFITSQVLASSYYSALQAYLIPTYCLELALTDQLILATLY